LVRLRVFGVHRRSSSRESRPATCIDGDRRQWTHGPFVVLACVLSSNGPSLPVGNRSILEESMTATAESEKVKAAVRETYGRIATEQRSAGCCRTAGCCGPGAQPTSDALG
jgi:hypothetical protein